MSPDTKPLHNYLTSRLLFALQPLELTGKYLVLGEVACRLSEESLPNTDACVFRRDIYEAAMDTDAYPTVAPALAIEVHSPSNRRLHTKAELYLEHGAEQVWLIYPQSRRVRVLKQGDDYDLRQGELLEFQNQRVDVDATFGRPGK